MKDLKNLLIIDKEFYFNGQTDILKDSLKSVKGVNYEFLNEKEIVFSPNISWGTLTISKGAGLIDGINVRAFLNDTDASKIKMKLKTNVRPEHPLIVAVFVFFLIMTLLDGELTWLIFYVVGLWAFSHIWFQFIYRLQENKVIDKVVKTLNLSRI